MDGPVPMTETLFRGIGDVSTRFLGFRFFVSAVGLFMRSLFSGLRDVGSSLGKIHSLLLFLVNDLLVVRNISWIGHDVY